MIAISPKLRDTMTRMRWCCLDDRTRHDVATVRQDDLADVLDLVDALAAANAEQAAIIERLREPVPAVVEPRLCTRPACERRWDLTPAEVRR